MARPRRPHVDYAVYLAVRLIVGLAQILTIEQSYAFARLLARIMYAVDKRHRSVGLENLRHAFGDRYTEDQRDLLVRMTYEHFCLMIMEMLHIPRKLHPTNWRERISLVGHEAVLDKLLDGGPIIMVTGHFGNWEMAGYLFGVFGFPTNSVARTLDNPHLDAFLRRFRERTGQKLISKNGGYDQMLDVLRKGQILGFIADQDAGQRGLFVDFFGRPASSHKAIALLAIEHQIPVLAGCARRIGPGFRYEVRLDDFIQPSEWTGRTDDVRMITQRYATALENEVRLSPDQYLWLHRRWKHQPKVKEKKPGRVRVDAPEAA